jgi:hypothetical protein
VGHQRLQLGAEDEFAGFEEGVVQRLDAEAVAHHEQGFVVAVPQREGEHAAKALHASLAPGFPGVDDDFGVGMGAEGVAQCLELRHQILEVVDLAVEDDDDRAVLVEQRLLSGGEVDDRQAAVTESDARFEMQPALVRTPMELGLVHAMQEVARDVAIAEGVEDAGYAAHGFSLVCCGSWLRLVKTSGGLMILWEARPRADYGVCIYAMSINCR